MNENKYLVSAEKREVGVKDEKMKNVKWMGYWVVSLV